MANANSPTCRQSTDPEKRMYDISDGQYGHITYANKPPSRKASLDDILDMGHAGESIATRDVMDPLSGALCYYYL